MYTPHSFKEENPEKLFDLIEENNFGILFSRKEDLPQATHLPFLVNRKEKKLIAHFAKANKHWKSLNEQDTLLIVFGGPHAYITPEWYNEKNTVPTWNYAAVHVYGKPRIIHEPDALRDMVDWLTHHHEELVESDWNYEAAHEKREKLLKAIVGIEIEILSMEATFKFNQNKSREDREGVIAGLSASGSAADQAVADMMKQRRDT